MAVKRDKKQIRDILKLIEEYDASIAEIAAQGEAQQKAAADAVQQLTEQEASVILRGMDVENINREINGCTQLTKEKNKYGAALQADSRSDQ